MKEQELESAFMEIFHQYNDAIFRFCLVKVTNPQLAEDMTQEVFMRYWQYLRNGKEITNPRPFLYTIANNLAKDWYKKKKSIPLEEDGAHDAALLARDASPEVVAAYKEVLAMITDMDEPDREVLHLRHVEGFEPREIADMLGETANVISVRLNRAMGRLKQRMHI